MTTDSILYPHRPLPNGCECNLCTAEARRDDERRDAALMTAVYELGLEQLRLAALKQVPAFIGAFS